MADESISVTCPGCGKPLRAPAGAAGKTVRCPECGARVPVPAEVHDLPPPEPEPAAGPFEIEGRPRKRRSARRRPAADDGPAPPSPWLGVGLLVAAVVVLALTSGFVFRAFAGPRAVTEEELAGLTAPPRGNYVRFTAATTVDTGLRYGKKGNEGTKYVLLRVGDRMMLCSCRVDDTGPAFVGRLEAVGGGVEGEVIDRVNAANPGARQKLHPVMLQAVRSIWFDTALALAAVLGLAAGGGWVLYRSRSARRERAGDDDTADRRPRRRNDRDE